MDLRLHNSVLDVDIAERGAELRSIRTADGAQWLWQGDPAWWGGRSPLLFPVVGRSPDNTVKIGGVDYPMESHGFARGLDFAVEGRGDDWISLVLVDSEATRRHYPFAFRLVLTYRLVGNAVTAEVALTNQDEKPMPAQFGFHPGFNWPMPGAGTKRHTVAISASTPPPLYRLDADKLLQRDPRPSPFVDGRLEPKPEMFDDDAMIFVGSAPPRIVFAAEGGPRIEITTTGLPDLGIWTKPGAPYLCIEPWHGTAPFADRARRLEDRNGIAVLAPGQTRRFSMRLAFIQPAQA